MTHPSPEAVERLGRHSLVGCDHLSDLGVILVARDTAMRPLANRTHAVAIPADLQIVAAVGVTLRAVRAPRVACGRAIPSHHVLAVRDGLKVRRLKTTPVAAQVIDHHAVRDRAAEQRVGNTMGAHALSAKTNGRVAVVSGKRPVTARFGEGDDVITVLGTGNKALSSCLMIDAGQVYVSLNHVSRSNGLGGQGRVERSNAPRSAILTRNRRGSESQIGRKTYVQ